ncbi:Orm1 type endoplasmic reticulum protein [Guyanagaster necrorhizus]|uniref:Orm1 type endoplasmic reticulum protein n=1 Tax=Guyanagaster necrorhizus TaxID=856835 RepID=A0A9P8ATK4_9AGAR|nr:Orm1 type endoplasmic reticulum protein [Guyanagaster necrorhizus MCA 3950]KAG7447528.1 Orm1 type endoplasmic reticulum protein [Guyanagaster necrorhizus MCA 3950]
MGSRTTSVKLPTLDLSKPPLLRGRGRSGSIVKVEQVGDRSAEDALDQSLFVNINANWVNAKGAWLIHVVLICAGKVLIDTMPGMSQQVSWTLVNLLYLALSYLMFHWVTGMPFEGDLRGGAYDDLTLWEQIDDGAQYTPAKKWLFSVPVVLFLASTHYTSYNPWLFAVNLTALIFVLIPKLPQLHRQRVRFMADASGIATPVTPSFPPSGTQTPIDHAARLSDITDAHFG